MTLMERKTVSNPSPQKPSSTPDLAIEDAVLFGNTEELDEIIDLIDGDEDFPDNLRHGIEALRYFRSFYGKDGELSPSHPLKQQKIALMESAWGAELLSLLRRSERSVVLKAV
jgi:hypothetical protein